MGSLRTCLVATLGLMMSQSPAPAAETDLLRDFAVCAGRLSALTEHHWLLSRDPTGPEAARDATVALVDALMTPADAAQVMAWRITAKAATRALLLRADLQQDDAAADRAAILLDSCHAFLLQIS